MEMTFFKFHRMSHSTGIDNFFLPNYVPCLLL